jgi:hypothetical protein
MNMQAKHQLTLSVSPRYLKANKEAKKRILDEYCANTGYHRKHAIRKLKEYQLMHGTGGKRRVSTQEGVKKCMILGLKQH